MLGLIERLNHVRAIGIDAARGHRVHQARLAQLAREAGRTTAQHIAGYERQRRHATLVAITLELGAALTDQAIDLLERLVGTMFSKAETRHVRAFQADGRAINEKVRLYARVGTALIAAREGVGGSVRGDHRGDPVGALSRQRRRSGNAGSPRGLRFLREAGRALRRDAPLGAGIFRRLLLSGRADRRVAAPRRRRFTRHERGRLAQAAEIRPDRFHPRAMGPVCVPGGEMDRRYYEFCVLSELCGRLRAGDVWVAGSRRYRSFEEHLISREALQEMLQADNLPVAVDPDFERFIASRHALLDARLAAVDAKAKDGLLLDVSLEKGVL